MPHLSTSLGRPQSNISAARLCADEITTGFQREPVWVVRAVCPDPYKIIVSNAQAGEADSGAVAGFGDMIMIGSTQVGRQQMQDGP